MVLRVLVPVAQGEVVTPDLTPDWTVVAYALVLALFCTMAVTIAPLCGRGGSSCFRS